MTDELPLPASARTVTRYKIEWQTAVLRNLADQSIYDIPYDEPVVLYAEVAALLTALEEKD